MLFIACINSLLTDRQRISFVSTTEINHLHLLIFMPSSVRTVPEAFRFWAIRDHVLKFVNTSYMPLVGISPNLQVMVLVGIIMNIAWSELSWHNSASVLEKLSFSTFYMTKRSKIKVRVRPHMVIGQIQIWEAFSHLRHRKYGHILRTVHKYSIPGPNVKVTDRHSGTDNTVWWFTLQDCLVLLVVEK